jgi:sterol desaturase/sphingolipid hydroxylase (fatty acid hydroxylase superfamily)
MDSLHLLMAKLQALGVLLTSPGSAFSVYSLTAAFAIGFVALALRHKRRRGSAGLAVVARAIFSWRLLKSPSTKADLFYFFVNTLALGGLIGWGLLSGEIVAERVRKSLDAVFGVAAPASPDFWGLRIGATLALFLAYEFGYWLDHFLKHKVPALWELHKTHHTAEVLTPLTAFRVHPLDTLLFMNMLSVCIGATMGLITHFAGAKVTEISISGTNFFLVLFIYATVQLQHSQFWIAFTGIWGRLLLSPAHHQIHHSVEPKHYNANLGSTIAIFDWMFGTLNTPGKANPRLRFGVIDGVENPHAMAELLLAPLGHCFARLRQAVGLRWPPRPALTQK